MDKKTAYRLYVSIFAVIDYTSDIHSHHVTYCLFVSHARNPMATITQRYVLQLGSMYTGLLTLPYVARVLVALLSCYRDADLLARLQASAWALIYIYPSNTELFTILSTGVALTMPSHPGLHKGSLAAQIT
jgi:hypothetical protein